MGVAHGLVRISKGKKLGIFGEGFDLLLPDGQLNAGWILALQLMKQ